MSIPKEDLTLVCPYCGHKEDIVAYINIDEHECDSCGREYWVTVKIRKFVAVTEKKMGE